MKIFFHLGVFIILISLTYFLHGDDFKWLYNEWHTHGYYKHGLYMTIVALVFSIRQLFLVDWIKVFTKGAFWFSFSILWWGGATALYLLSIRETAENTKHFFQLLAFLFLIKGYLSYLLRERGSAKFNFSLFYLALAIPLPYLSNSALYLKKITFDVALIVSRFLSIFVETADNILKVGAIQLPIDPAFTGIESFILLFSLVLVLIYLFELRTPVKVIMLLLCLPLIFIGSVVRILTCILLAQYWSETATILYWNVYSTHTFYLASFLVIGFMWFVLKNIFKLFKQED